MKINEVVLIKILISLFCLNTLLVFGNDSTYVERQNAYVNAALLSNSGNKITLQAKRDLVIDSVQLEEILSNLPTRFTADFQIVELIRVLFYSDSLYDEDILPVLTDLPFWINEGDTVRNYWTENHMIMWMSSEWLLHERYGWPITSTLRQRLIHYLELKLEYGFYEFFSSVYLPYTLSGLLNLYDFTEDPVLKDLSMKVAQRLLQDLLIPTTDLGVYYPAAGRNYPGKYKNAYGQNHSSLIYLLTGMGEVPTKATHAGAFLATSSLPVDELVNSWTPYLDTKIHVGHSLDSSFIIHSELSPLDRLIFQWSSTAYAHPDVIEQTFNLLADSSFWGHKDWGTIRPLSAFVNPADAPNLAEEFNVLTYSSIISGYDLEVFKNKSVALMSIANLWKGKIGFQQWPFAATVGTTAVYLESGEVKSEWGDRDPSIENTHMPQVEQNKNLALIMYRPEPIPIFLDQFAGENFEHKEVALFWQEDAYDEIVEDGNWLLGRQGENYVAVRRTCTEKLNDWWACETDSGQTWVVMVGDGEMYGSFIDFQNMIAQSEFSEEWYYDYANSQMVYHSKVIVDSLSVEYAWGVDSVNTDPQGPIKFSIYPNPSNDFLTLNLNSIVNQSFNIKVVNSMGSEIYYEQANFIYTKEHTIKTASWPAGMYTVTIESDGECYYQKLINY